MSPPTAPLGKNGPQVQCLGFGLMGLSSFYGNVKPDNERLALLDKVYELGQLHWDSADMYGDSEDLLGKWFKANPDKRKDIFLATKFANKRGADGSFSIDSSPEYAKAACAKSLQRLGLENVDLYYCHRLDQKTPIEKTIEAMVELKNEGKINYLGLSECSSESLRRAHAVHPISAVQVEYSPFALEIESNQIDLLRTCRELGVAVVAYSPIGRGLLTGTLRSHDDLEENDLRRFLPRFTKENFPKNLKLVDQLSGMAKKKGVTPTQLVLAWLMQQGQDIFPIPGTTKLERVKENLESVKVTLSKEEEQEIRRACEAAEVSGDRYDEKFMSACYADTPPL
ncbi:aldo/keto reductase-like protein [Lentithecium fluviatile CBS 122367]|uniref:Aldo/keto reductase-like protein n=1 Tax=Lentithecium fluviatile CBS 122367 TaxID=1168545 RepID=A0A6G1JPM0_9PLEO|nr:aldo/keto reductase-like protein [Lentithecium fluviatile CBS 122367]